MDDLETNVGGIAGVQIAPIELKEPFIDFAARFAARPGTVVLMSGTNMDCARYHILGLNPWLTLRVRGQRTTLSVDEKILHLAGNPFDILQALHRRLRLPETAYSTIKNMGEALPVMAGLFGYLSYDLKDALEVLP